VRNKKSKKKERLQAEGKEDDTRKAATGTWEIRGRCGCATDDGKKDSGGGKDTGKSENSGFGGRL